MTLVVGISARAFNIQVSDRRLTSMTGSKVTERDFLANKTVVLVGPDGCLSISYSGLAHIRSASTDDWIASILTDAPLPRPLRGGGAPSTQFDTSKPPIMVSPALGRLKRAIQDLRRVAGASSKHGLYVLINGYLGKKTTRGILVRSVCYRWAMALEYARKPGQLAFNVESTPTYWSPNTKYFDASVGQPSVASSNRMREAIANANFNSTPEQVRDLIAANIRDVSSKNAVVGRDCMSVCLYPSGQIQVTYLPDPAATTHRHLSYTPWIVGMGAMIPPQEMMVTGSGGYQLGPFKIEIDQQPPPVIPTPATGSTGSVLFSSEGLRRISPSGTRLRR